MKEYIRQTVMRVHELFLEHPFFGPLLFIVLTTALMLPPFGGVSTDAIKYACLLLGFGFLGFSLRRNLQVHNYVWLNKWLLAWVAWVTCSVLFARDHLFALIGNYPRYNSSWMIYLGFGVLIYAFVSLGQKYLKPLIVLLSLCSFIIALFGILQSFGVGYYGGLASLMAIHPDRVPSLVGNPNFSSWYVACVLPFAILGLIKSRKMVSLLVWALTVFISCWALVMFASRGAILGAVVGVLVLLSFFVIAKYFKLASIVAIVGLCAVFLFSGYYSVYRTADSVAINTSANIDTSAYNRFVAWDMARIVWQAHPLTGIGPGNFDQYYWELLPSPLMGGSQYFDDAHNVFLVLLVDLGLPGFTLFMLLIAGLGLLVVRKCKGLRSLEWWMAGVAGIVVWLVACVFNPAVVALWVLLALMVAVTILACEHSHHDFSTTSPSRLFGFIGGIFFIFLAVGFVLGEYVLVYNISIEPYKVQYTDILPKQNKLATWAQRMEPYNLEVSMAKIDTNIQLGRTSGASFAIARAFALHPYSARSALLSAQVSHELWKKTQDSRVIPLTEQYLNLALKRSNGYPVVEVWAANYYWETKNVELSEKYARIAAGKKPDYYFNWLLLAKQYREKRNLQGMVYALTKAQALVPDSSEMKEKLAQLKVSKDPFSLNIVPVEPPFISRLH